MSKTRECLVGEISPPQPDSFNKVTVVGVGQVGMACAFTLLAQGISNDVVLLDVDEEKLKGEVLDIQHGSLYLNNAKIDGSTDYAKTANSKICIITAGVRQKTGESRLNLVQRNTDIYRSIIPQLIKYSSDTILLVVSNPVDILTYVAWKISGLPKHRVIGSGTNIDTSRFRYFISEKLGIAPSSCNGYIIGEHGDSSVAVWSGVNVAGVRLRDLNPEAGTENDTENWNDIHTKVINSAYEVIKLKGYTSWSIGLIVGAIVKSILRNSPELHAVSLSIKGFHGIEQDVFLSLPAVLGSTGLIRVVNQQLEPKEIEKLKKSAKLIDDIQRGLKF